MFQLDFGILPKTGSLRVFMEKATAPDVLENFEAASKGLNKNKFTVCVRFRTLKPFGTLKNYCVKCIKFLMDHHLEREIMREFCLLQKKIILNLFAPFVG